MISVIGFAQSTASVGFKAGVVSAGMQGDAVRSLQNILDYTDGRITTGSRLGVFGGAYVNIPVSEIISVEPGLYYTQKGYSLTGDLNIKGAEFLGVNASANLHSHYIDLPVTVKANLSGFQIFAGPQVSYLAKADLRTRAGVLGFNLLNKTLDATSQFNRWDVAITGGLGYQFANGVNISASYDHGLSRVDNGQSFESYNRAVKLGVGIQF